MVAVIGMGVDSLDKEAQEVSMARKIFLNPEVPLRQKSYGSDVAKNMRADGTEIAARHGHLGTKDELVFVVYQSCDGVSGLAWLLGVGINRASIDRSLDVWIRDLYLRCPSDKTSAYAGCS